MKKTVLVSTMAAAGFLMLGCSSNQPAFDSGDTVVEVVNGKSYNIPKGAHPSPYVDAKVIKFYKEIGLSDCQDGDITWEEEKAKEEMGIAISKGDKGIYKKLAKENRIGCASPIK